MGDGSVQDLIASHLLPLLQPLSHKFQAAGREDIDVRMLGSGRPFLLELKGARRVPTAKELRRIELEINEQERGKVGVCQLQLADSRVCALMRQGEAEKQKSYVAVVWISRPITQADVAKLESIKDLMRTFVFFIDLNSLDFPSPGFRAAAKDPDTSVTQTKPSHSPSNHLQVIEPCRMRMIPPITHFLTTAVCGAIKFLFPHPPPFPA
ncbi:unnamed protein product [Closterium sp. NIES-54]